MNTPNTPSTPPVKTTPKEKPVVEEIVKDHKNEVFSSGEKIPCDWDIKRDADRSVVATHTRTQKVFMGTMKEFNKALRG